jgi:putative tryptophan/tyrosine transport system substrate-binding protein
MAIQNPSRRIVLARAARLGAGVAGAAVLGGCELVLEAPRTTRRRRVGWLSTTFASDPVGVAIFDAFRDEMRRVGWTDGVNIAYERRHAETDPERLPPLAVELVGLPVDVLITSGAGLPAAIAATSTTPIVMTQAQDPVGSGFVASLGRPGGNVTGPAYSVGTDVSGKRVELLKEAVRSLSRMAWLVSASSSGGQVAVAATAAAALGIQLRRFDVASIDRLHDAFADLMRWSADGLFAGQTNPIGANRDLVLKLVREARLPGIYNDRFWVVGGGLMAFGPNILSHHRYAATYVDRILRGANPGELPVEQPTDFELVVNVNVARSLALRLTPSLAGQVTEWVS